MRPDVQWAHCGFLRADSSAYKVHDERVMWNLTAAGFLDHRILTDAGGEKLGIEFTVAKEMPRRGLLGY
jgi:hypothetical protein